MDSMEIQKKNKHMHKHGNAIGCRKDKQILLMYMRDK